MEAFSGAGVAVRSKVRALRRGGKYKKELYTRQLIQTRFIRLRACWLRRSSQRRGSVVVVHRQPQAIHVNVRPFREAHAWQVSARNGQTRAFKREVSADPI